MRALLLVPFVLLGCPPSDNGSVTPVYQAPAVAWLAPADGATLGPAEVPLLRVALADDTDIADLALTWSADTAGALVGEETRILVPDAATNTLPGATFALAAPLPVGTHRLTVVAVDPDGLQGSATATLTVVENPPPTVEILQPAAGAFLLAGDLVQVRALFDDDGDPSALTLQWSGEAQGLGPLHPGADGIVAFDVGTLGAGTRSLGVTVTDPLGATDQANVTFSMRDADLDDDTVRGVELGGTDCDDLDPFVYPGAPERCNGEDDDCDGEVDEGATAPETWYRDADGDGHGAPGDTVETCDPPEGYSPSNADCDDTDDEVHPGADERCNGEDDDCDGQVPANETTDVDDDGVVRCEDCQDAVATTFPGAPERCNGVDDDCDGVVPTNETSDADNDGSKTCADCADNDPNRAPGKPERCNGIDDDCNGQVPTNEASDADNDGSKTCADCDDTKPDRYPGNAERCDARDQDCDDQIDEGGCADCEMQSFAEPGDAPHVYQFCEVAKSWDEARGACRAVGYTLLTVNSAAENDWAHAVVDGTFPQPWWIGYADQLVEGSFGWEGGSSTYVNWNTASGEPNNIGDEDCAQLNFFQNGTWNDAKCGETAYYICEVAP